jgi:hypothetical protein
MKKLLAKELKGFLLFAIASVCFAMTMTFAADYDADQIDDAYAASYGYSTNGYQFTNMVLWVQMDNTASNVVDRSVNNLTGSVSNFIGYIPGLYSNAFSFNSNTYVLFPTNGGVFNATSNQWTISAWYQGSNSTQKTLIAKWSDITSNTWEFAVASNGIAQLQLTRGATVQTFSGISLVNDQVWHHLAGTVKAGTSNVVIYVDGDVERKGTATNWSPSIAKSFVLGAAANTPFTLDETRLYKTALSSNDILRLPPTYYDIDGDGLSMLDEMRLGTNPNSIDTDADGTPDNADPLPTIIGGLPSASGLKLWLRGDYGITLDGSGYVSTWLDQSGNGNHASQSISTNRPSVVPNQMAGKAAIKFDGANDFLQTPNVSWPSNDYTYFFVWKKDGAPLTTHTVISRAGTMAVASNNFQFTSGNGNVAGKHDPVGSNADATTIAKFNTNYTYVSVLRKNSTANGTKVFVNGLYDSQSGTSTASVLVGTNYPFFIGGWNTSRANMSLAEVLVYDRNLSLTERGTVEKYLRDRYTFPTPTLPTPTLSLLGGTYLNSVAVTFSNIMLGSEIRYTTNGSVPTVASSLYTPPLIISNTATLKAAAFLAGYNSSAIVQNTFNIEKANSYTNMVFNGVKFWVVSDRGLVTAGTAVTNWLDQSGLGNNALQATSSKAPVRIDNQINGKPVVKFDGTNDYLMAVSPVWAATNSDYSYFIVWKKDNNAKTNGHVPMARASSLTSAGNNFTLYSTNGTSSLIADALGTDADAVSATTYGSSTNYMAVSVTRKNNTANGTKLYVNGSFQGESSATATNVVVGTSGYEFYLGGWGTAYGNLSMAEVVVYDRTLADSERQAVEKYIGQKYAITMSGIPTPPATGLIGRWSFEGNAQDSSGNGNHGTVSGAALTAGKFGQGYAFDGNDSINVGNLDFSGGSYSVSAWIKTTYPGAYDDYRMFITKMDTSIGDATFELFLNDGFHPGNPNDARVAMWKSWGAPVILGSPPSNCRDGNWHMVTLTYQSGQQNLYVDGVFASASTYSGPLPLVANPVMIGGVNGFGIYHHPWIGEIDEVLIYNRPLAASEVQQIYGGTGDTDADGMADSWEMTYFGNLNQTATGDFDGDGVTNRQEFLRGTNPSSVGSKNVTLYVDSLVGNDTYDGLSPTVNGGHGPRKSIQSMISGAVDGDTISIASGNYIETRFSPGAKKVTLKPVGSVRIK